MIYGERGIGKTSTLHILTELARDARYLVVYVSCGAGSNFDETIRQTAADIPLMYHSDYGPTASGAEEGRSFATLLPSEPITVRVATELFARVAGTRVLVILDEFDRCESGDFRRSMAELLKSLSDRAVRVQVVVAGVAADLTELVEHVPSIQRNILALRLPKMEATELRALLKKGGEHGGVAFKPQAEAAIVAASGGIPYLASLLSYLAGSRAIDAGRSTVETEDVAGAVADALTELKSRISKRSQAKIAECVRNGAHLILGALAGRAQVSAGVFKADDMQAIYPKPDQQASCEKLVDSYADPQGLLQVVDDEDGRAYRFREESVMPYIWLLSTQALFANSAAPDQASSPADSAKAGA